MLLPWKQYANWRRDRHLQTGVQRRRGEADEEVTETAHVLVKAAAPPQHLVADRGDAGQNAAQTLA